MDVGIGLPNTIPGTDGRLLVEWARRADAGPFSSLGVLDRLAYDAIDPFAALAAAAGVTERVGLATMIAIGPEISARCSMVFTRSTSTFVPHPSSATFQS